MLISAQHSDQHTSRVAAQEQTNRHQGLNLKRVLYAMHTRSSKLHSMADKELWSSGACRSDPVNVHVKALAQYLVGVLDKAPAIDITHV